MLLDIVCKRKVNSMAVLEVDHLTKDYGFGRGVFDVSFHVDRGEVYGFLGPNGAGKSTTIRHLMGFSRPDKGECRILGKECFTHYAENLRTVGYIPGEIALPQALTGREFLEMMLKMEHKDDALLSHYLELFALDDATLAMNTKHMSLGVKRKLAVITAFVRDPEVLILDEPTSGLDPLMQDRFISLVKEQKAAGKTILLSSHIFSEVDATCDRIGIIKDGKLVSEVIADELRHTDNKNYRVHFADTKTYTDFLQDAGSKDWFKVLESHDYSNVVILSCRDAHVNELITLLKSFPVESFSTSRETLQEYFMTFYKESQDFGGAL